MGSIAEGLRVVETREKKNSPVIAHHWSGSPAVFRLPLAG